MFGRSSQQPLAAPIDAGVRGTVGANLEKVGGTFALTQIIVAVSDTINETFDTNSLTPAIVAIGKVLLEADLQLKGIVAGVLASPIREFGWTAAKAYFGIFTNLFIVYAIIWGIPIPLVGRVGIYAFMERSIGDPYAPALNRLGMAAIIFVVIVAAYAYVAGIKGYIPFSGVWSLVAGLVTSPHSFLPSS